METEARTEAEKALAANWGNGSVYATLARLLIRDVPVKLIYGHRDGAEIWIDEGTDLVRRVRAGRISGRYIVRALHHDAEAERYRLPAKRKGLFWRYVQIVVMPANEALPPRISRAHPANLRKAGK